MHAGAASDEEVAACLSVFLSGTVSIVEDKLVLEPPSVVIIMIIIPLAKVCSTICRIVRSLVTVLRKRLHTNY